MYIYESPRKDKRYMAIFHDGKKVHFGSKNGQTYIDHHNNKKRENYISRHKMLGEDWSDPYTPGTLSRFLLWEKKDLGDAIRSYKKRFDIK